MRLHVFVCMRSFTTSILSMGLCARVHVTSTCYRKLLARARFVCYYTYAAFIVLCCMHLAKAEHCCMGLQHYVHGTFMRVACFRIESIWEQIEHEHEDRRFNNCVYCYWASSLS